MGNGDEQAKIGMKLSALLMEYDKLRDEIVSRLNNRFAVIGYLGAMLAFIMSQASGVSWPEPLFPLGSIALPKEVFWPALLIVIGLFFLFIVWRRFGALIKKLSRRISEIEQEVNLLIGEEVLVWETRQIRSGLFHKL
jgi:hypothetical protein